ncbi:MAG TPA: type II secretion system protein [bacterium]
MVSNSKKDSHYRNPSGYSLVEMLIVCAIILTLATIPIALLKRAREKAYEVEAIASLKMVATAYEDYYATEGRHYPNFRSDSAINIDNEFVNGEHVWDTLIAYSMLPRKYSGRYHADDNLLARGYYFSIFPSDYGTLPGSRVGNTYAFGLFPVNDSVHKKGIVVAQGQRFFSNFPSAVPRKTGDLGLSNLNIYTLPDD